jgi:hypothetical protein
MGAMGKRSLPVCVRKAGSHLTGGMGKRSLPVGVR